MQRKLQRMNWVCSPQKSCAEEAHLHQTCPGPGARLFDGEMGQAALCALNLEGAFPSLWEATVHQKFRALPFFILAVPQTYCVI